MLTNNPKYILPGSKVYMKQYSDMFVYPGEDGFKNPNMFLDNRGRCFSKAWLLDTSTVLYRDRPIENPEQMKSEEKPYYYDLEKTKSDIVTENIDIRKKIPSNCLSCSR